ncbi:AlpA family phage regulatory protein [Accumulibacter sp.]|uniref:helix-turn-helix transcriptional regulator n=1 Tax=Accumulibacter sp. TaxID=2053492 RepID=UPI0025E06B0F|nr:AlpA family phage regulatory protein [Accumulibacter sp.]MCM8612807.1 AlpA family phage regulatory protein [Accumulibacter sp.]MCM8636491.1 AlpA family phage regulatory protein [Accumulibacter sp.]MCM8640296.1 AlpA family phage regulatory protein [Accumulibacter sp.]
MAEQLRYLLRLKQITAFTGMSRSWTYEAIRRGEFPAPIPLSARAVAWDSASIAAWQAARIAGKSDEEIRALVAQLHGARKVAA